jgi:putative membrane protein
MTFRKLRSLKTTIAIAGIAMTAPVWAVSLAAVGTQPLPDAGIETASLAAGESVATGSGSLVPLMAADMQANHLAAADARAPEGGGAAVVGKPLDDIAFVKTATENGRKEVNSAREALPQLKSPELKRIAQLLVTDHNNANARLSQIAAAKQWPVPAPGAQGTPPSGTAASDFDAKWTGEMIAGHERSIALYRAQAAGGEDLDVRNYARDTLPTIEQHLAQLKSLQK